MDKPSFPLGFDTEDLAPQAREIATQFPLTLDQQSLPRLQLTKRGLVLLIDKFSPLMVDFSPLLVQRRLDKTHGLIRACKPAASMTVLDVTAGWGRDAGLLAQYGAQVLMLERQPVMAALLADGLQRLPPNTLTLACIHQDALIYLSQLEPSDYPDVIYIDPMHPERHKSALVKKDMQALQQLFGPDQDAPDLLNLAVTRAKKRVVVKWPQRLVPLKTPDSSIPGKTVRFDVYIPQK